MSNATDWYYEKVRKAEEKNPDMEDRYCSSCYGILVRDSIDYYEGYHIDGCPENDYEDVEDYS